MAEELMLPLVIEEQKPKKQPLKRLEAWPIALPNMEPMDQANALARQIGIGGSADIWRHFFKDDGYYLSEFVSAIAGVNLKEVLPFWEHEFRPKEILCKFMQIFKLNQFPVGDKSRWEPSYVRSGREYQESMGIVPGRGNLTSNKKTVNRKPMSEAQKIIIRKRNAMKRVLKQYGMFADQFIGAEYERKGWHEWTKADDQLWAEEKAKAFTVKKKKKRKAKGRCTDNDALLKA